MSAPVLVVLVEPRDPTAIPSRWTRAWRAPLAAGRRLGWLLGQPLEVLVLGPPGTLAALATGGAAVGGVRRWLGCDAALEGVTARVLAAAVARAAHAMGASAVLMPHDYAHVEGLPALAGALDAVMVSGAVAVAGDPEAGLIWSRPAFEGRLVEHLAAAAGTRVVATVRGDGFAAAGDVVAASGAGSRSAVVEPWAWPDPVVPGDVEWLGDELGDGGAGLTGARRIVAVGRGLGDPDRLAPVRDLVVALGAELAGSRPVIDAGWLPRERQVGSSGATVTPELYLALGISGSAQHLAGMSSARCVVAVNKDPEAPIFRIARFGVIGDLHDFVPELLAALRELPAAQRDAAEEAG
ncbi:MAG TPA: FAD-binding protein [Thermoanaerobaculia bacterium]|nr:FAD-binding protein [Thermoanaerobaculia bacterium]